jgi:hypothetical protein
VLRLSTSAGRHGSGHRASETLRQRLSTATEEQAEPSWLWWLAMSATWCGMLMALAGLSSLLGSVLLTELIGILTFGVLLARTGLRVAGRSRRYADAHPTDSANRVARLVDLARTLRPVDPPAAATGRHDRQTESRHTGRP